MRIPRAGSTLWGQLRRELGRALVLLGLLGVVLFVREWVPAAPSLGSAIETILNAGAPLYPLALGSAIVISVGDIDLSIAGLASFFGTFALMSAAGGDGPIAVFLYTLLVALLIGILQAWLIASGRVAPLVLTLGTSFVGFGLSYLIFSYLDGHQTLPPTHLLPMFSRSLPWMVGLIILGLYVRGGTLHGIWHLAVGANRDSALRSGIPVERVRFAAFLASTLLCYLFAMLMLVDFTYGGWNPDAGKGRELEAIATAVIGGTVITGGWIAPVGIAAGTFVWIAVRNLTVWLPMTTPESYELGLGALVLSVAILNSVNWRHTVKAMLRKAALPIGLFLLSASVVGCGADTQEQPIRVVAILPTSDNPYWRALDRGIRSEGRSLEVEVEVLAGTADDGVSRQIEYLNSVRTAGSADALILGPAAAESVVPALRGFVEDGLPIVVVDSRLDSAALRTHGVTVGGFIGSENRAGARKAAELIRRHLGEDALNVLLIEGSPVHQSALDRRAGFLSGAAPGWGEVNRQPGEWRRDRANEVVRAVIGSSIPDAIFAASDEMAMGAIDALRDQGVSRANWPLIVGFDATEDGMLAIEAGNMCASIRQQPTEMGRFAVGLAKRLAEGDTTGIQRERMIDPDVFPSADVQCR